MSFLRISEESPMHVVFIEIITKKLLRPLSVLMVNKTEYSFSSILSVKAMLRNPLKRAS